MDKKYENIAKKTNELIEEKEKIDEDIKTLAQMAIESKNEKLIYLVAFNFIEDLSDDIIDKMLDILIEKGDTEYLKDFAALPNLPPKKFTKLVAGSTMGNLIDMKKDNQRIFAEMIKDPIFMNDLGRMLEEAECEIE